MGGFSRVWPGSALLAVLACSPAAAQTASDLPVSHLSDLSIEQLSQMQVTSVSKAPEVLSAAPASLYVITRDEILRSGATTIPEILRLAPNLEVFQTSSSQYVITARGFNGNSAAQSFSNKLLVLIDGRSVYTPLFSGVYWDLQHVLPGNIERVEVISGPGATLWGANAVNGVINIITRSADETQGGSAVLQGGTRNAQASLQYGGRAGPDVAWRIYAEGQRFGDTELASGAHARDHWSRPQAGFRMDWTPAGENAFTLQGDMMAADEAEAGGEEDVAARNVLGRWVRRARDGSELQLQGYYDYSQRHTLHGGGTLAIDIYDVDLQHSFGVGPANDLVWGGGFRAENYDIHGTAALQFDPAAHTRNLANVFVQDTITVALPLKLTLGLKAEDDPYSGVSLLPNVRLAWTPQAAFMAWTAVSRAVRSPTPFDVDVREFVGPSLFLSGDQNFRTEKVTAYEAGVRLRPSAASSLSISAFYNHYDDLRSIELDPVSGFLPLLWGNGMRGSDHGVEIWGDYDVTSWWRLSAAYTWLHEDLEFKPSSSGLFGLSQAGNDPAHQAQLSSSIDLPNNFSLDAHLRYVSALPNPRVPSYVELNGRIGWQISNRAELALTGLNLLHDRHLEYSPANEIPREIAAEVRLRY